MLSYLKRVIDAKKSARNMVIEYELFPYLPYFFERQFLRGKRYILNYDDNLWYNYRNRFLLRNKYDRLVRDASGVIVANDYIYKRVYKLNPNTIKIPTVIDLDDFAREVPKFDKFTLVWIGTPVTYKFILSHREVFQELAKKIDYDFLIIASRALKKRRIENVSMSFIDWSPSREIELLTKSHIGVMPLDEDEFSRGKSAFKVIQYIAAGLPVVASSVGENRKVIEDGKNGYLVSAPDEWIERIVQLHADERLCGEISNNNQQKAYDYSIQKYFGVYKSYLDRCFSFDKV